VKEMNRVISPTLIKNRKQRDSKNYTQIEGGIASVVLNLNAYLKTTDNESVKELMEKYEIEQVVRILNVGKKDRTSFFTPVKTPFDFWFQMYSDWFEFDQDNWQIISKRPGEEPSVELKNSYYLNMMKILESFEGTSIIGLDKLSVTGCVSLAGTVLGGEVVIDSEINKTIFISEALGLTSEEKLIRDVKIKIREGVVVVEPLNGKKKELKETIRKILDFLAVRDKLPSDPDLLLVLGTHDTEIPREAARVYMKTKQKPSAVIFCGGVGRSTRLLRQLTDFKGSEAETMRDLFIAELKANGYSESEIYRINMIVESKSTNTGQNIAYTKEIIEKRGIAARKTILMQFAALQKRSLHTFDKVFGYMPHGHTVIPDIEDMNLSELQELYQWVMGELDRLQKYGPAGEGFITEVDIPPGILNNPD